MTKKRIIYALLRLASKNPSRSHFTIAEIAKEAHLSKQAIYRKHYKHCSEIIDEIHDQIDSVIYQSLERSNRKNDESPFIIVAEEIIPSLYEYREIIRILHITSVDPSWTSHFELRYNKWVLKHIGDYPNKIGFSREIAASLLIRYTLATISVWLSQELPTSPSSFQKFFLRIMKDSFNNYLKDEYKLK